MEKEQNLTSKGKKKPTVLLAALDWGLGHASRCVPIIHELLALEFELVLAYSGTQLAFWKQEFPALRYVEIPGYGVKYATNSWSTQMAIVWQIPKILIRIKREKAWLRHFLSEEDIQFIISDNRYGLQHSSVTSVFITHQLGVANPAGAGLGRLLGRIQQIFLRGFHRIWVPDWPTEPGLAGMLSHPRLAFSNPVEYIGPLSRFRKLERPKDIDVLAIISGPEPQRGILEKKLMESLRGFKGRAILIRGLPDQKNTTDPGTGIQVYNHLEAAELNEQICRSHFVICRSGYSSIMDLLATGSKSIMIPTPGQPEQEYLACRLSKESLIYAVSQDTFDLEEDLRKAGEFNYRFPEQPEGPFLLRSALAKLLQSRPA